MEHCSAGVPPAPCGRDARTTLQESGMRVFVTGGTGLVGSRLIPRLHQRQDHAVVLTRRPAAANETLGTTCTIIEGDPMTEGAWMDALAECDAVVNLAGAGVFDRRW